MASATPSTQKPNADRSTSPGHAGHAGQPSSPPALQPPSHQPPSHQGIKKPDFPSGKSGCERRSRFLDLPNHTYTHEFLFRRKQIVSTRKKFVKLNKMSEIDH